MVSKLFRKRLIKKKKKPNKTLLRMIYTTIVISNA